MGVMYETCFDEKLLGIGCNVKIIIDINSGNAETYVEMRSFLRSTPDFRITLEDLKSISEAIKNVKRHANLLEDPVAEARTHKLNYSCGGAILIVVHPKEKVARFTLSIGYFSREGALDALPDKEILDAVAKIEKLKSAVMAKLDAAKS